MNYKLSISKRPHGGYCCFFYVNGQLLKGEGYFTKSLPTKEDAINWGRKQIDKARNYNRANKKTTNHEDRN